MRDDNTAMGERYKLRTMFCVIAFLSCNSLFSCGQKNVGNHDIPLIDLTNAAMGLLASVLTVWELMWAKGMKGIFFPLIRE